MVRYHSMRSCFHTPSPIRIQVLVSALLLTARVLASPVPAFPEATGAGARSIGGRGGKICEVTTLRDSGNGSLRSCVNMIGPRIVVFRVSGRIELASGLIIRNPYITIAGQTAPAGGILLSSTSSVNNVIDVLGHDVILRYLRIRTGYNSKAIQAGTPVTVTAGNDIIIDHCSLSWTTDENANVWGRDTADLAQPHNVTYSWNLIAEPLKSHSTSVITGANKNLSNTMTNIDLHHNVLANSSHRNPLIKNKTFRFINNIVYNWSYYATQLGGGADVDIIGNLYKTGPLYPKRSSRTHEVEVFPAGNGTTPIGRPTIFLAGNIGPHNSNPDKDNWVMVREVSGENGQELGPLSTEYRRASPLPALPVGIPITPAKDLEKSLLPTVGASHRLDCLGNWVFNQDTVDMRIIKEYYDSRGIIPTTEEDVGGFPVIAESTPCRDTDHDGMPDAWEDANGLDKNDPADGALSGRDGYSHVERYLNGVGGAGSVSLIRKQ